MSELCKKCSAKSESNFIGRQTCFFFGMSFGKGVQSIIGSDIFS